MIKYKKQKKKLLKKQTWRLLSNKKIHLFMNQRHSLDRPRVEYKLHVFQHWNHFNRRGKSKLEVKMFKARAHKLLKKLLYKTLGHNLRSPWFLNINHLSRILTQLSQCLPWTTSFRKKTRFPNCHFLLANVFLTHKLRIKEELVWQC